MNAQEWTAHINSTDSDITLATPSSGVPETLNFGTSGELTPGTKITPSITYSDGTVVSFDIDLTNLTSIGGSYIYNGFDKDGRTPATYNPIVSTNKAM